MSRNWTFGQRLGFGFSLVVLLTAIMGSIAFYALRATVESKERVIGVTAQDLIDAETMRAAMYRMVANVRGQMLTGEARFEAGHREAGEELAATLARIRARSEGARTADQLAAVETAATAYQSEIAQLLKERAAGASDDQVEAAFDERVTEKFDAMVGPVRAFVIETRRDLESARQASSEAASTAMMVIGGLGIAVVVLAVLIAVLLTRGLTRQIGASVQQVKSSSAELQTAATQQASGATEQATAMNEIATTISELLTTSRQIAESAKRVSGIAGETAAGARVGTETVLRAQQGREKIQKQVDTIVVHMLDLGRKSQEIGSILEIINELAEQTNILAINATIEAAGAGEAGRRFSVVGEEIRKLADRVGASTKEIRSLIEEVRAAVNTTVMATEAGAKSVDAGAEQFDAVAASLQRIAELVHATTDAAREIELSTKQQSTAVEQVNVAISNVAQATKEAEAGSGQTLQTASQLASMSHELSRLVHAGGTS